MDIGKEIKIIEIEPIKVPEKLPEPITLPEPEREKVPA